MLSILGLGSAYADHRLGGEAFKALGFGNSKSGTVSSTLTKDYIISTKNSDPKVALKTSGIGSSALGVRAAAQAIERAGISKDEIGLLIGDTGTPVETTPSEGQRIACGLDLKIPAYDISSGGAASVIQLATILSWQPARLPKYTLIVSSNLASHRVNYSSEFEATTFGDGASAAVVSYEVPGKLVVEDADFSVDLKRSQLLTSDIDGALAVSNKDVFAAALAECTKSRLAQLRVRLGSDVKKISVILPQFPRHMLPEVDMKPGVVVEEWENFSAVGNILGASVLSVLADNYQQLSAGQAVALVDVGAGLSHGYLFVKAV